jgi:type II secretory pathway pseudopilin PulG
MSRRRQVVRHVMSPVVSKVAIPPLAPRNPKSKPESGYALLFVLFIVATLILFAASATPSIITQGRREREQEALWRGNQYDRAIRLYYRKNGRYPQTLEDLSKADQVGNHYLRKAYRDPLNTADGAWRVIYVTPAGQLVGSIRYHSLQEMAASLMPGFQPPTPAGAAGAGQQSAFQPSQAPGAQPGQNPAATAAQGANQANPTANQPNLAPNQANQAPNQSGFSASQPTALAPLEAVDGPVMGAFAIGVASKVKQPSLIVYQGGKTYFDWEFIYNPLMNAAGAAQLPTPNAGAAGAAGAGAAPGAASPNGTAQPAPGATGGTPAFPPRPVQNPTQFPPDTSAPPAQ